MNILCFIFVVFHCCHGIGSDSPTYLILDPPSEDKVWGSLKETKTRFDTNTPLSIPNFALLAHFYLIGNLSE